MKYFLLAFVLMASYSFADPVEELHTSLGTVKIEAHEDNPEKGISIVLNDEEAYRDTEGLYLSLYNNFLISNEEVILFGKNGGGNCCPNDNLNFLILSKDKPAKIVTDENFISNDGTLIANQDNNKIYIQLGYENKSKKIAIYEKNKVTIKLEKSNIVPIPEYKCRDLYESTSAECVLAKQLDKNCKKPTEFFSGIGHRTLLEYKNHPSFDEDQYNALCKEACKSGGDISHEKFNHLICGIK